MTSLLPGSTVGIIGGGQLARMMVLEARRMGYRSCVLSPRNSDPAVDLSNEWVAGEVDDEEAAKRLARRSDVITVDTEHVPASILEDLALIRPVRPSASVLRTVQDRRVQRAFLRRIAAPQPRCESITSIEALEQHARAFAFRGVLKSAHAGYDGKGQAVIQCEQDLPGAWETVGRRAAVLEEFVDFDFEISILLARNPRGDLRFYPVALNTHRHQVLRSTFAPAPIDAALEAEAIEIAGRIANALDHVGMMAVEMFVVGGRKLLVNEIAPRPHNSGHFTFGACGTSQFEQHLRAVVDLPLGDPALSRPAAIVNIFGDLWLQGQPDWTAVFSTPEAHLHLYDKVEPRPGRKMGHVLVLGQDPFGALQVGERILEQLSVRPSVTPKEVRETSLTSVER